MFVQIAVSEILYVAMNNSNKYCTLGKKDSRDDTEQ